MTERFFFLLKPAHRSGIVVAEFVWLATSGIMMVARGPVDVFWIGDLEWARADSVYYRMSRMLAYTYMCITHVWMKQLFHSRMRGMRTWIASARSHGCFIHTRVACPHELRRRVLTPAPSRPS